MGTKISYEEKSIASRVNTKENKNGDKHKYNLEC